MALAFAGALAFVTPAAAQIVNGTSGTSSTQEAPIGTKAGGSDSSMQAPGEANAAAGAAQNARDFKNNNTAPGTNQTSRTRTARRTNDSDNSDNSSNANH